GTPATAAASGDKPPIHKRRRRDARTNSGSDQTFFFQAEDGIRGRTVTGVQTCALPISSRRSRLRFRELRQRRRRASFEIPCRSRSEERRVGKECRSRLSAYH